MSLTLKLQRRTAKKQEDVPDSTWRIKQLLDFAREGAKVELETDDDKKYIADKFSHKGFDVTIGKFDTQTQSESGIISSGKAYKGFAFIRENETKYNLETPMYESQHEAGKIILQYINAFRKQRK